MATLERPREDAEQQHADPSQSAVPTPFPASAIQQQHQRQSQASSVQTRTDSRSPSSSATGGRRSLSRGMSGMMDKIKRTVSASKERGQGQDVRDGSRGRSGASIDTGYTDETRGRTGRDFVSEKDLTRTSAESDDLTLTQSQSATQTLASRSTSRGRPLLSTGRGGAGNMRDVAEQGEEDEEVVRAAKENRSQSRERTGREEWVASGRGGQGNIRSRSRGRELDLGRVPTVQEEKERDEVAAQAARDREVMEAHIRKQQANQMYTTGRGGAGNVRHMGA